MCIFVFVFHLFSFSFSPLIGSLALRVVGPLHLLLQPAALLLQLQQRLWRMLLFADQDDLLQKGLFLTQELHEVPVPVGLGPPRPALTVQLCELVLDTLHPERGERREDRKNRFSESLSQHLTPGQTLKHSKLGRL